MTDEKINVTWITTQIEPTKSDDYIIYVNNCVDIDYFSQIIGWDCEGITHWAIIPWNINQMSLDELETLLKKIQPPE